jgi:VanZ family protein
MSKDREALLRWLPLLAWMTVVFLFSSDSFSVPRTSRFLGAFFGWLLPNAQPETIATCIFAIRKLAHALEYAVLALLAWRALGGSDIDGFRPWIWNRAARAWLIAAVYAASDEWHQSFVPSRGAAVVDVLIDATGAAVALAFLALVARILRLLTERKWNVGSGN